MENQIADKDQLIARLEKQRNRLEKEKEEEAQNAMKNKDDNENKSASLNKLVEEKEVIFGVSLYPVPSGLLETVLSNVHFPVPF